jgi:ribosomal protein L12E/L44/L45/RPP1/RPP2
LYLSDFTVRAVRQAPNGACFFEEFEMTFDRVQLVQLLKVLVHYELLGSLKKGICYVVDEADISDLVASIEDILVDETNRKNTIGDVSMGCTCGMDREEDEETDEESKGEDEASDEEEDEEGGEEKGEEEEGVDRVVAEACLDCEDLMRLPKVIGNVITSNKLKSGHGIRFFFEKDLFGVVLIAERPDNSRETLCVDYIKRCMRELTICEENVTGHTTRHIFNIPVYPSKWVDALPVDVIFEVIEAPHVP